MQETMIVHQALSELKTLNKRIVKAIDAIEPIAVKEHASQKVNGVPVSDFIQSTKEAHQSATALIARYNAIKAAISDYNAGHQVQILGKTYSVAQAIWFRREGLNILRNLLDRYTKKLEGATRSVNSGNGQSLDDKAERAVTAVCGGKDKVDLQAYLKALSDYKTSHELEMVDPLGLQQVIKKMSEDIAAFEKEADSAIQIANATTTITIEY